MTIKVNKNLCTGCGTCVALCPDVFKINIVDGKSEVINQKNVECAKNALINCPVQAISMD